jgi:hypothetical protein
MGPGPRFVRDWGGGVDVADRITTSLIAVEDL